MGVGMNLSDYIIKKYITQAAFARSQGVTRQQVTKWINGDFIVVNGKLYSLRRDLNNNNQ